MTFQTIDEEEKSSSTRRFSEPELRCVIRTTRLRWSTMTRDIVDHGSSSASSATRLTSTFLSAALATQQRNLQVLRRRRLRS